MLKLSGLIVVTGASTIFGLILAGRLTERCRLLRIWLRILNIFQTEICYKSELLPVVFKRTANIINDRRMSLLLHEMGEALNYGSGLNVSELWSQYLKKQDFEALSGDDRAVLQELGGYLGSTDREDQLARIKLCRARLEQNMELADYDKEKYVKIYRYLGFAIGATIVCFLL